MPRSKTALSNSLLALSLVLPACASARPVPEKQILTAKDEQTAQALKRIEQAETLKKITKVAGASHSNPEEAEAAPGFDDSSESGPSVVKAVVTSEPAPGLQKTKEPPASAPTSGETASTLGKTAAVSGPSAHSPGHSNGSSVSADQSLKWLMNGNTRYVKRNFRADGRLQADRDRTTPAQKPHAIVLSCADSRVPAEMVFDQGIGEIFTIRVAGEALDSSVIASAEYAVEHLGPKLIVVMGHTKCGAVDAAIKIKEGESAGSEALDRLLADIRPRLKTIMTEARSKNLEVESALNADGVARDLLNRSEIIRKKVDAGELTIKSALYWLDSGKVKFY